MKAIPSVIKMCGSGTRNALVTIAVVLGALGGWFLHSWYMGMDDEPESFGEKREWATLQRLELISRSSAISNLEFTNLDERSIVCLPSLSGKRLRIMLNPKSLPYYKQMPAGEYSLSKEQLDEITAKGNPTSTVSACLATHVRFPP